MTDCFIQRRGVWWETIHNVCTGEVTWLPYEWWQAAINTGFVISFLGIFLMLIVTCATALLTPNKGEPK